MLLIITLKIIFFPWKGPAHYVLQAEVQDGAVPGPQLPVQRGHRPHGHEASSQGVRSDRSGQGICRELWALYSSC